MFTSEQQKELDALKLKDLKTKNCLFQVIDGSILKTIFNKEIFKDIWNSMKHKYQLSAIVTLHDEFETIRVKFEESITKCTCEDVYQQDAYMW